MAVVALPARADREPDDFFRMPWPAEGPASAQLLPKFRFLSATPARWPGPYRWRYNPANAPATFASTDVAVAALIRNGLPRGATNDILQSEGSRNSTNDLIPSSTFLGFCPGTSRQVIFTEAFDGITVFVPTP